MYKRQMVQPQSAAKTPSYTEDESVRDGLLTVGMKVRHAVANGYKLPTGTPSRVPLPAHMSQPPLLGGGLSSTFATTLGSNLHDWISGGVALPELTRKRGYDEIEPKNRDLDDFVRSHGNLSFDENF